ncbi:DUF4384 domain-containing protein [Rhodopseudomonas palustris]|uniref:DUF4384 domain-containing protein n=1 Tax=Rhodopseudomonas palustris TaxID=1076 RepID=UPI0021F33303|nr:DUF4384 domain-containing protein [Rhodopseudomonas palustris]UYO54590.1 DUF4384 domain-containing protein [Rhodopseudomonas palustris]UYO54609.1 DUF4384 domain-containing protein [Rhodopseudomonas palustris]
MTTIVTSTLRKLGWGAGAIAVIALGFGSVSYSQEEPRQITVEQLPIFSLQPPPSTLGIDIWTNRSDATYRIGEELMLFLRTSYDASVTVLNVDAAGRTTRLFPNKFAPDNRLHANQVYQVPGTGSAFKLKVGGPVGINLIKVIATTNDKPVVLGRAAQGSDPFETYDETSEDLARQIQLVMSQSGAVWTVADRPIRVVSKHANLPPPTVLTLPSANALSPPVVTAPSAANSASSSQAVAVQSASNQLSELPFGLTNWPSAFVLDLRSMKPVYKVGEELMLTVTPERSCKLTLFSIDAQNNATILYPNRLESPPSLSAGRTTFLPGTDGKMRFTLLGSPGVQKVVALCGEEWSLASLFRSGDADRAVYPTVSTEASIADLITAQFKSGRKLAHATASFVLTP